MTAPKRQRYIRINVRHNRLRQSSQFRIKTLHSLVSKTKLLFQTKPRMRDELYSQWVMYFDSHYGLNRKVVQCINVAHSGALQGAVECSPFLGKQGKLYQLSQIGYGGGPDGAPIVANDCTFTIVLGISATFICRYIQDSIVDFIVDLMLQLILDLQHLMVNLMVQL